MSLSHCTFFVGAFDNACHRAHNEELIENTGVALAVHH